jgi:hypothetical protein
MQVDLGFGFVGSEMILVVLLDLCLRLGVEDEYLFDAVVQQPVYA